MNALSTGLPAAGAFDQYYRSGRLRAGRRMSNVDEIYDELPELIVQYIFGDSFETPIRKAVHGDSSGGAGAAWLWKD